MSSSEIKTPQSTKRRASLRESIMEKRPATAAAAPGPEVPCDPAEAAAQKDHTAMYMAFIHETRKYNLDCEKRFGDMTLELIKLKDEGRDTFMNVIDCKERIDRVKNAAEKTARDLMDLRKNLGEGDDVMLYEINSDGELIEKVHKVEKVLPPLRMEPPMVKARASAPPAFDDEGGAAPRGASYAAAAEMAREVETMPPLLRLAPPEMQAPPPMHMANVTQAPPPALHAGDGAPRSAAAAASSALFEEPLLPTLTMPPPTPTTIKKTMPPPPPPAPVSTEETDMFSWTMANQNMGDLPKTANLTVLDVKCLTYKRYPGAKSYGVPRFAVTGPNSAIHCAVCEKPFTFPWMARETGVVYFSCFKKPKESSAHGCVNLVKKENVDFVKANLPALWEETKAFRG